jgi:hypothetical protein
MTPKQGDTSHLIRGEKGTVAKKRMEGLKIRQLEID